MPSDFAPNYAVDFRTVEPLIDVIISGANQDVNLGLISRKRVKESSYTVNNSPESAR